MMRLAPTTAAQPDAGRQRLGLAGWVLLAPLIVWVLAFVVAPTAIMLVYSFCRQSELGVQYSPTLENYQRLLSPSYLPVLARALGWGALAGIAASGAVLVPLAGRADLDADARWRRAMRTFLWAFLAGASLSLHFGIFGLDYHGTYLKIFWRSMEYAGLTTLICLLAGYPVAYLIGRGFTGAADTAADAGDDSLLDELPASHVRVDHDPQAGGRA